MLYHKKGRTTLLVLFAVMAVYLCPCSPQASAMTSGITKASMHDCCKGMAECPRSSQNTAGMNSFLDTFLTDGRSAQAANQDLSQRLISPQSYSSLLDEVTSKSYGPRLLESRSLRAHPPDLFIQFQSLLI